MAGKSNWSRRDEQTIQDCANEGLNARQAHERLQHKTYHSVRAKLKATRRGTESPPTVNSTQGPSVTDTISGDRRAIFIKRTHISTEAEFLAEFQVDTIEWTLETLIFNSWEMGAVIDKEVVVTPLYQAKGTFKRNKLASAARAEIEAMLEDAKLKLPTMNLHTYETKKGRKIALEISIPDQHFGKYAEVEEVGHDYNLDIAERLFRRAVEHHIRAAQNYCIERIVFVAGNDVLNTDNSLGTTTKGTPQQATAKHKTAFRRCRIVLTDVVRQCSAVAPVDVVMVSGNHDNDSVFAIGEVLSAVFEKDPNVTVYNGTAERKAWTYGKVFLMFTHGDKGKKQDLPLLMASEFPTEWGRTEHREIHCAHLHKEEVDEKMGTKTRILPSLTATDTWHQQYGFVKNKRVSASFIWDANKGFQSMHVYVPDEDDL